MTSFYSIIRFCPTPDSGEFLNAGVIAFEDDNILCKFVEDWDRLRRFSGMEDIRFLINFAKDFERGCRDRLISEDKIDQNKIKSLIEHSYHLIQFSQLKASTLPAAQLLLHVAKKFLPEKKTPIRRPRNRAAAIKVAASSLAASFSYNGGLAGKKLLKSKELIVGKSVPHQFDLAIVNGHPKVAINAFSFEGQINKRLNREVGAAAFDILDVKENPKNTTVDFAIVMLQPSFSNREYDKAVKIFSDTGASIIIESQIESWAESLANN